MNRKHALVLSSLIFTVGCDQLTKSVAVSSLRDAEPLSFLGNLFRLEYAENPGAFLSLGYHLPPAVRAALFVIFTGAVLLGGLVYLFLERRLNSVQVFALSLMIGGGASNLFDRVLRTEGRVIDFLNLGLGDFRTGIFNVADLSILAGMLLFIWKTWGTGSRESSTTPSLETLRTSF